MTQPVGPGAPVTSPRPLARPESVEAAAAAAAAAPAPVNEAQAERAQDFLSGSAGLDLRVAPGEGGTDLGGLVDEQLLDPAKGVVGRDGNPDAVRALQSTLNALGAEPPLTVDGALGPRSVAAIRAFQEKVGLTADGVAGPNTLRALQAQEALALAAAAEPPEAAMEHLARAEALIGEVDEGQRAALSEDLAQAQNQAYAQMLANPDGTEATARAAGELAAQLALANPSRLSELVEGFKNGALSGEQPAFAQAFAAALSNEQLTSLATASPGAMAALDGMQWVGRDNPSARFEEAQAAADTAPGAAERAAAEAEAARLARMEEVTSQPMP